MLEITATKAKELLAPIPENEWYVGDFSNHINACCAMGHLVRIHSSNPNNYSYSNCFADITKTDLGTKSSIFLRKQGLFMSILDVNDGDCKIYQQPTPKKRVLALLDDMIEAGY